MWTQTTIPQAHEWIRTAKGDLLPVRLIERIRVRRRGDGKWSVVAEMNRAHDETIISGLSEDAAMEATRQLANALLGCCMDKYGDSTTP